MKLILNAVFLFLFSISLSAQGYIINDFHVDIKIESDGSMDITEKIESNFTSKKRGIIRSIPYRYKFDGKNYRTKISEINVPHFKKKVSREGANVNIRIGDPNVFLSGPHTYEISYKVSGAVLEYEDGQEFYWNINGLKWDTDIENISFAIHLPKEVEIEDRFINVTTGRSGSTAKKASFEKNGRIISGQSTDSFGPGENMTVAVKFPTAYLDAIPAPPQKGEEIIAIKEGWNKAKNKPWYVVFPILLITVLRQWWYNLRNKNKKMNEIIPQSYPPDGMTPIHVGAYIDHSVQSRDVVSLIPYWATEGFVKVQGMDDGDMILFKESDLPTDYPAYEREFFDTIFEGRRSIAFSEAQNKFGGSIYKVKKAIVKELEGAGYYDENYSRIFKTYRWPLMCALVAILGTLVIIFTGSIIIGIGIIVLAIFGLSLSFFTAPLSNYGQQIHNQLKGLEKFMKDAPEDEVRKTLEKDPDYFGRMLPYAVALGLDKQWMQTFEPIRDSAPAWFYMSNMNTSPTFSHFSKSFEVKEMTRAFTTHPAPETGSGGGSSFSSGGGFSGGGFGGGGGSSW